MEYLGLEGGPPGFIQDFSCPVLLWCRLETAVLRIRDFYALWTQASTCSFCFDIRFILPVRNPNLP